MRDGSVRTRIQLRAGDFADEPALEPPRLAQTSSLMLMRWPEERVLENAKLKRNSS